MRRIEPPSAATWMLEHLTPGKRNEALAGDLLEEVRNGRTAGWYWRQVLVAIAIGCLRDLLNHRSLLIFAALWSLLAPGWSVLALEMENHTGLFALLWRIDWPWSTICSLGLPVAIGLAFIWAGVLLYLIPHMWSTRAISIRRLGRSLLVSLTVYIVVLAGMVALVILPPSHHAVDQRTLTPLSAITDLTMRATVGRLFSFLPVLSALWGVSSLSEKEHKRVSA